MRYARFAVLGSGSALVMACFVACSTASNNPKNPSGGSGPVGASTTVSSGGPSSTGTGSGGDAGTGGGGGTGGSLDAGPARTRPLILIALTGSNALAETAAWDDQWTYVRANLDGFWGNNAGISPQDEAALWKKINGRLLISEWDSVDQADFVSPVLFTAAEPYMPGIVVDRQQICLYTNDLSNWNGTTIAEANANYVTNPSVVPATNRFQSVCTGYDPQAVGALLGVGDAGPIVAAGAAAEIGDGGDAGAAIAAYEASAGTFVELLSPLATGGVWATQVEALWQATHAKGGRFIWFNSITTTTTPEEWLANTQTAYQNFKALGLIQPNDVIALVNYGGQMPSVPEVLPDGGAAATTTGIAYWLLHQE
jgi:hypothetical protein